MSRIRIWEDTIVIALRDMQWINISENSLMNLELPYPPGFMKFDGTAEQKIGDLSLVDDERFFIFEVKSERTHIRSEWHTNGTSKEKLALKKLKGIDGSVTWNLYGGENISNLRSLSLRGHYFAYWVNDRRKSPRSVSVNGNIYASPYLIAAPEMRTLEDESEDIGLTCLPDDYIYAKNEQKREDGPLRLIKSLSLNDLFGGKHALVKINGGRAATQGANLSIGLTLNEFTSYLNFLCKDSKANGEKIHAVVMSNKNFFRVVCDTNYLGSLLSKENKLIPERKLRDQEQNSGSTHHVRRDQPSWST